MRTTVKRLRELIQSEAKVGASPEYLAKERVREVLQQFVQSKVASGEVKDDRDLQATFDAIDMSTKALKMIPFDVWRKMAG